jgi:DNA-binding MarR family transcriptional regulator
MGASSTPIQAPPGTDTPEQATVTRRMFAAFLRAAALAEPIGREVAARHGISLADLHAVRVLELLGDVPVSRLGAELGLHRSTVTNLVDRLERSGLVERLPSRDDRRVTLVRPTPAGVAALETFQLVRDSELVRRLLQLDHAQRAVLADLLERITAPLEEPEAPTPAPGATA